MIAPSSRKKNKKITRKSCITVTNTLPLSAQKGINMKYSEFYRMIEAEGWYIKTTKKHKKYIHPTKSGFIPVGKHQSQEVPKWTLESMKKRAGLKLQ